MGFVAAVLFIGLNVGTRMFLVEPPPDPGVNQSRNAKETGDCDMIDAKQPTEEDEEKQTGEKDEDESVAKDVIDEPREIRGDRSGDHSIRNASDD